MYRCKSSWWFDVSHSNAIIIMRLTTSHKQMAAGMVIIVSQCNLYTTKQVYKQAKQVPASHVFHQQK